MFQQEVIVEDEVILKVDQDQVEAHEDILLTFQSVLIHQNHRDILDLDQIRHVTHVVLILQDLLHVLFHLTIVILLIQHPQDLYDHQDRDHILLFIKDQIEVIVVGK